MTDRAVLALNWAVIPDQLRMMLHRECDSEQQFVLRARWLAHDPIFGRYFRVKPAQVE